MGAISLGLDMGTTSAKCLAVDETGAILALAQYPYPMAHPRQGWAEQDPEDYWQGLVDVVSRCVQACTEQGRAAREIGSLAMSTQGDTLILADEDGVALGPAMSWMDVRPAEEFQALLAEADQAFWYRELGIRLVVGSSACKVRWIRAHQPERWAQARRVCAVPDYLAARLTGRFVTDAPSASWSPYFSPFRRDWSPAAMALIGVEAGQLPAVVESGADIGELLPDVARLLGLPANTRLLAGAFDQAAAGLGANAQAGETCVLSCGTAWVLYAVSRTPPVDPRERAPICCHADPHAWGLVLPFAGGAVYDWYRRTFPRSAREEESRHADPLVFIPHLYGGGSPDWRAASRGTLFGLTMAHGWDDVEMAIMRGIGCETRRNIEVAEELGGPIPVINMVGGASKSDAWPQILADLLHRPIEIAANVESACYGAARLAAGSRAAGWHPMTAERHYLPNAAAVAEADAYYRQYLRAYAATMQVYDE